MILLKDGVRIKKLIPQMYSIYPILESIWSLTGVDTVITSANDSTHNAHGPNHPRSLHYEDRAYDIRSKNLNTLQKKVVLGMMEDKLKPLGFDVCFEGEGLDWEHFHIEYDPK